MPVITAYKSKQKHGRNNTGHPNFFILRWETPNRIDPKQNHEIDQLSFLQHPIPCSSSPQFLLLPPLDTVLCPIPSLTALLQDAWKILHFKDIWGGGFGVPTGICIFWIFCILRFNWRVTALQYWVDFCHISTQISHRYTCLLLLEPPPHPIPAF